MLENQFINIQDTSIGVAQVRPIVPVRLGWYIDIFIPSVTDTEVRSWITLVDESNTMLCEQEALSNEDYVVLFGHDALLERADQDVEVGQIFHIRIDCNGYSRFSQRLVRVPDDAGFNTISYKCDEDAFGFPFHTGGDVPAVMQLPIMLSAPQFVQDDETYVKSNGEVVTLFAKYYREWEGETEYLSEAMHNKIIAALSCDEVYINGRRVTKSDNYQIDWENYDLDCDGKTKLARATFKVRENITQRNSNY